MFKPHVLSGSIESTTEVLSARRDGDIDERAKDLRVAMLLWSCVAAIDAQQIGAAGDRQAERDTRASTSELRRTPVTCDLVGAPMLCLGSLSNNGVKRRPSANQSFDVLTLDGKSFLGGAKVTRGDGPSPLCVLRAATQRAARKGSNPPVSCGTWIADRDRHHRVYATSCY